MDNARFTSLLAKLDAATWSMGNAISNTKIFSCEINGQKVRVFTFGHANPLYINGEMLDLTDAQIETMITFATQLETNFNSETQSAEAEKRQSLITALNRILE